MEASAAAQHQHALALRPATQTDAAFLSTVYRSVREPELQAMGWPEAQIDDFCNLQHRLRTAGYEQYLPPVESAVVLREGSPVGLLAVCHNPERWVLVSVELLPAARGKGIGTKLLARLQRKAAAAGVEWGLQAASGSPVLRLCERCGFASVANDGMVQRMEWPHEKPRGARKPAKSGADDKTVD